MMQAKGMASASRVAVNESNINDIKTHIR